MDGYKYAEDNIKGYQKVVQQKLYQDTFLKAMELLHKINYDNHPKSFLISIALHFWINKKV